MNGKRARALRRQAVNQADYKALKRAHTVGNQGQAPKLCEARRRKPAPTFKGAVASDPQRRLLIVERPLRALREKLLAATPRAKDGTRTLSGEDRAFLRCVAAQPKHVIAAAALTA